MDYKTLELAVCTGADFRWTKLVSVSKYNYPIPPHDHQEKHYLLLLTMCALDKLKCKIMVHHIISRN